MKVQLDKLTENRRWGIGTVVNVADDVGREMIAAGVAHQVPDNTRDRIVPYTEDFCVPIEPPAAPEPKEAKTPAKPKE